MTKNKDKKLRGEIEKILDRDPPEVKGNSQNAFSEAVKEWGKETVNKLESLFKKEMEKVIGEDEKIVKEHIDYIKKQDLHNGWSLAESGECCDKCKMKNPTNPLQALVGCTNPFQLKEHCQCHIPFRKVAKKSKLMALENLMSRLKQQRKRIG